MGKKYKSRKHPVSESAFLGGNYALLPFLAVILIIPLIVRVYYYTNPLSMFDWYPDDKSDIDAFLYYKAIFFSLAGFVITVLAAYRLRSPKILHTLKREIWLYFLGAFGLLTFLSTVFSKYPSFGFHGVHEQFESIWVVLSYCVVVLFAYLFLNNARDIASVRHTLAAFFVLINLLGLSQLFGHDFFETALGRYFIVPNSLAELRNHLTFVFSGSGTHQVYMSLYNPNYVGVFAALILPIALTLTFSVRRISARLLWACISVSTFLCSMGSGSKSFLIALIPCLIIGCIFLRKKIAALWRIIIPFFVLLLIVSGLYFRHIGLNPFTYLKSAMSLQAQTYPCEDIRFTEDGITIRYAGNTLKTEYVISGDSIYLVCSDAGNSNVQYTPNEELIFSTTDTRFTNITFQFFGGSEAVPVIACANISGVPVYFTSTADGYSYVSSALKLATPDYPETISFLEKHPSFASDRGYIWSRSIPLLKNSILLGTGADTFSAVYPQNDVVGKVNGFYNNELLTKPHCLYLQIGIQYGIPALICFLAICGIYLVGSFRLYWRCSFCTEYEWFGLGLAIGVLGYLITGIANDSTVALAPLFWSLLGVGFAVNRMNRTAAENR